MPEVDSTTVLPGFSRPSASSASIIATLILSFTECVGLKNSSFASRSTSRPASWAIRESRISAAVSAVATNLDVRGELARRQQAIIAQASATGRGIVAEGRDITTVIAPDAPVRILLTADEEARLRRRQRQTGGQQVSDSTRDEVLRRDRDDSTVSNFTTAADGVTTIDTSDLDLPGSVEAVVQVVLARSGRTPQGAA